MNEKEKKLLIKISVIIVIIIALGLSATILGFIIYKWSNNNNQEQSIQELLEWFAGNFGTLILGIIVKVMLNKRQLNDIDKKLIDSGLKEKVVKNKQKEPAVKDKKVKNTIESRRISGY